METKHKKYAVRSLFFIIPAFASFCGIRLFAWATLSENSDTFIGFIAFLSGFLSIIATGAGVIWVGAKIYSAIPDLWRWAFSNEN